MTSSTRRTASELLNAYAAGEKDFSGWSIHGGVLLKETFEGCTFDRAQFRECAAAFSAFVNCSFAGAGFAHCIFGGVDFLSSSLDGCSFTDCVLDRCDYFMSTLRGSHFVGSSMRNSCFIRANLCECHLSQTHIDGSIFGRTMLSASVLFMPSLERVVVTLPHVIAPAELKQLYSTVYAVVLLKDQSAAAVATRLDEAPAGSRVTPDIARALCASIPGLVEFLERGGISSDQLVPLRNAIDLTVPPPAASVFLSYATTDEEFAHALATRLSSSGVDVWFARRSMRGGQKLYDQLMREIDTRDRVVLIVSKASMASPWVQTELRRAFASTEAPSSRRRVVPVLLVDDSEWRAWRLVDGESGRDFAHELRFGPAYSFTQSAVDNGSVAAALTGLIDELMTPTPSSTGSASMEAQ